MYIGIDIGGGHSTIGLVDDMGEARAFRRIETTAYPDINDFVSTLATHINNLAKENKTSISAIGLGAPNGNYYSGCIEQAPNLPWKGTVPLANLLSDKLGGIAVKLTNDANAAAIGELRFGIAKTENIQDFIMITLGTGLGSGVVVDNKLIYGHDGFAGELGHVLVYPNAGRLCGCGRKGCLERYASASGLVFSAIEALEKEDSPSSLRAMDLKKISALDVYKAADEGDLLAIRVFDETARILAFALANATTITSPKAFIIFGGLAQAGDLLLRPLKKYFEEFVAMVYRKKVLFLQSALPQNQAAVLGAAALAMETVEPTNELVK